MSDCLKCDGWGCTWCRPQVSRGEQALSLEELREGALKDRVRELEAQMALSMVPRSIAEAACRTGMEAVRQKVLDAVMDCVTRDPSMPFEAEARVREIVRRLR